MRAVLPLKTLQVFNSKITMLSLLYSKLLRTSGPTPSALQILSAIIKEQALLHLQASKVCKDTRVMALARDQDQAAVINPENPLLLPWTIQKLSHL
jgi:hypothetical protein